MFWTALIALWALIGFVATKMFKVDDLDARQARFEESSYRRMDKYEMDLGDVRVDSKVTRQNTEEIKKDFKELKHYLLERK